MRAFLSAVSAILDDGWFSRILVFFQFWFCYFIVDWSMAYASTSLATGKDLLATAAVIGAVSGVPQGLLMMAPNAYMQMRAQKPVKIVDRRGAAI